MKVKLRLLAVVAICALLVPGTVLAFVPPLPFSVEGHITINGLPASEGTVVTAEIELVEVATYTTLPGIPPYGPDYYFISIDHDDSYGGQMVVFYVNGVEGGQVMYGGSGGSADLDLAIGDTTPPTVTDKSPTGSRVAVDTVVTATFSEAMDTATITSTNFTLAGSAVSGTVSYDAGTYTATFDPDADLGYGHTYTATLSTAITDAVGNHLASDYSWSFTTVTPAGWGQCGPIDLVIVLDDTGSMGGAIGNIKAELPEIIEDALIASAGDLRMGYITFKDDVTVHNALTDDLAAVMTSIDATTASGGAGGPEASDEAKNTAVNNLAGGTRDDSAGYSGTQTGDFTEPYRDDALRIVVLITDAPPGGFNDSWDDADTEAMHTHALTARDKGIFMSDIYVCGADHGGDAAVAAALEDDAETTGGIYTGVPCSGVGVGVAIRDIIARCEELKYDLTVSSRAGGSVTTPGEGTFSYDRGEVVNLVAEADAGYEFDEWTGDVDTIADVNDPTTTITMNGNYSIRANFTVVEVAVILPVQPPEPANFAASYLRISPQQVLPDQQLEISINIANHGGEEGSHTVALYINGYAEQSETVGVSPGSTKNVIFRVNKSVAGIYQVSVEGQKGQFTVVALPTVEEAGFWGGPLGTGGIIAIVVAAIALALGLFFVLRRE